VSRAPVSSAASAAPAALTAETVAGAAQLACLLEVSAPKPGNVSPGRHFVDTRYEDFLASAVAIGGPLAGAATRGIGATVRLAIENTARWTRTNTNLGIVLLFAPIARAALVDKGHGRRSFDDLRGRVRTTLAEASVEDAREVYEAIRLAAPGGLGRAEAQDVAEDPTLPLLDVMRLAAERDGIAREYATGFELTFVVAAPAIERARQAGLAWDDAIVETFLKLLSEHPDTHVARRGGAALAEEVSHRARRVIGAGGVRSAAGRSAIEEMDRQLRSAGNTANPGTTADVTAAAVFAVLLKGLGAGGGRLG
jgi:triphosphoribosyl-dephospho-CoA synthase